MYARPNPAAPLSRFPRSHRNEKVRMRPGEFNGTTPDCAANDAAGTMGINGEDAQAWDGPATAGHAVQKFNDGALRTGKVTADFCFLFKSRKSAEAALDCRHGYKLLVIALCLRFLGQCT